jgi:hypothetical protein
MSHAAGSRDAAARAEKDLSRRREETPAPAWIFAKNILCSNRPEISSHYEIGTND